MGLLVTLFEHGAMPTGVRSQGKAEVAIVSPDFRF
jgi:hypothetical protein